MTHYATYVIKTFADKRTEELFVTGKMRRFPSEIIRRALSKLEQINAATNLSDLTVPPSNRLHALGRDREGQHSISVNDQWRICFLFEDGEAYDVEVCDYH